jgi:hypothetical protein
MEIQIKHNNDANGMRASSSIAHLIGLLKEINKELKEGRWAFSSIACRIELLIESTEDYNGMWASSPISCCIQFLKE